MTKQEVVNQVSAKTGLDPLASRLTLDAFFEVVKESLSQGEPIYIRRFGSFILKRRAAKVGRNIGQNTAVIIAAHVIPAFKPSIEFTDQVKEQVLPIIKKKAAS